MAPVPFHRSVTGAVLTAVYLCAAAWAVWADLQPSGGDWINLRGMLVAIATAPSQATLGVALRGLGLRLDFSRLGAIDYAQIVLHVAVTALCVYTVGWGVEALVRRFLR